MDWDAVGAIGEIVGATAVVVSLLYLAIQIRTQNRESRLAAMNQTVAAQREGLKWLSEPQVTEDFLTVIEDFSEATPAQKFRFTMLLMNIWKVNEAAYLQFLSDRLEEEFFQSFSIQLADFMTNESVQLVWRSRKHQFDGRFREYVENLKVGQFLY